MRSFFNLGKLQWQEFSLLGETGKLKALLRNCKTVKTLSLMQPWAMFIAIGLKTNETRSWNTAYRGPLLIHASQTISTKARAIYEKIKAILGPDQALPSFEALPRGAIICQVKLEFISRTEDIQASGNITFLERALGDYGPGRFVWQLTLLKTYTPPLRAQGHAGLWVFKGKLPCAK